MINLGKNIALFLFLLLSCQNGETDKKADVPNLREKIIERFTNGSIKSVIWYKDGKKDSIADWYHENGQLAVSSDYSNGKNIGETIFYYPNGMIQQYDFYNNQGQGIYHRKYSRKGEVLLEEGITIFVSSKDDWNNLRVDKEFSFFVFYAAPPNTENQIFVAEKSGSDSLEVIFEYKVERGTGKVPFFLYSFKEEGHKKLYFIGELRDTIRNTILRDTISYSAKVLPLVQSDN